MIISVFIYSCNNNQNNSNQEFISKEYTFFSDTSLNEFKKGLLFKSHTIFYVNPIKKKTFPVYQTYIFDSTNRLHYITEKTYGDTFQLVVGYYQNNKLYKLKAEDFVDNKRVSFAQYTFIDTIDRQIKSDKEIWEIRRTIAMMDGVWPSEFYNNKTLWK
jgi:hypothetical protein